MSDAPQHQLDRMFPTLESLIERNSITITVEPSRSLESIIAEWNVAATEQKAWREKELKLRQEITKAAFNHESGTEYYNLPAGWRLKCEKGSDYKLDADKTDAALEHFDDSMAALLVKWEPKLSLSNYKILTDENKAHFVDCLTIKSSMPTLTLVPPKGEK